MADFLHNGVLQSKHHFFILFLHVVVPEQVQKAVAEEETNLPFLPLIFIEEPSANYYLFHLFGLYVIAEGFRQTSEYVVDRPNQARNKGYFREYMAKDFPDEEQPLL